MAALCLFALPWLAVPAARAHDSLQIPPECGSDTELSREIDALRAREAPGTPRPEVRLAPGEGGYVLEIDLPDGTRTLRDPDCRALFRAAIVIAALGRELPVEGTVAETTAPVTDATATPPRTNAPPPASPPPPVVEDRKRRDEEPRQTRPAAAARAPVVRKVAAFLQVEAAHGVVPGWSTALSAGAVWRRGLWGVRGWFGYLTPHTVRDEDGAVRIQALDLAISLELWPLSRLGVGLGTELFLLRGQGVDVQRPHVDWTAQPAPHLALRGLVWSHPRGALELTARAVWSPKRSEFALEGGDTLYRAEAFAFQLGLAGSVQFL